MKLQKRLAAQAFKCSPYRVKFLDDSLKDIKEAITKFDIVRLINQGIIARKPEQGTSRGRARHRAGQRRKGRQSGHGNRKGKTGARDKPKDKWMNNVRAQRRLIKSLRENDHIDGTAFRSLYGKVKGGFFRSTKHIKLYIEEQNMVKK